MDQEKKHGSKIFDEEYAWHYAYYRDFLKYPPRRARVCAMRKAIDYWRRFTKREFKFFAEDDVKYAVVDSGPTKVDLRDTVKQFLEITPEDDPMHTLGVTLFYMFGLDHKVGTDLFAPLPFWRNLEKKNIREKKFTHKLAAKLAGFSVKDKGLKKYWRTMGRLGDVFSKLGMDLKG